MEIGNSSETLPSHSRRQFVFIVVSKTERKLVLFISQTVCRGIFFLSVPGRHQRFIPSLKRLDGLWTYSVAIGGFYPSNKVVVT